MSGTDNSTVIGQAPASNEPLLDNAQVESMPTPPESAPTEAEAQEPPRNRVRAAVTSAAERFAAAAAGCGASSSARLAEARQAAAACGSSSSARFAEARVAAAAATEPARERLATAAEGLATAAEPLAFWRPTRAEAALAAAVDCSSIPVAVSGAVATYSCSFEISVSEPVKLGEGMAAYIGYKVSTTTELNWRVAVTRRYNDFVWLHAELWKESAPGVIVPPLPEKALTWRFSEDKLELRRRALQNFLMRVAAHPTLPDCKSFKAFLEAADDQLAVLKENSAESLQKGFCIWATSSIQSMNPLVATPTRARDENDDKVDAVKEYISNLELQMSAVHKHTSSLIRRKRDLASSLSEFSSSFQAVNQGESDGLETALSQLGRCAERLSVPTAEEAQKEAFYFEEPIKFYTQMIAPVRRALAAQTEKASDYETALAELTSKENTHAKLEGVVGKEEKCAAAAVEVQTAYDKVDEAKHVFEKTTETFLGEVERFKRDKGNDFKKLVVDYTQLQLEYNQQAEAAWRKPWEASNAEVARVARLPIWQRGMTA